MWGTFFWAHFGSVILCEHLLNTTLSIVADYVLKGASNELMCHVKKVKPPQTRFLSMTTSTQMSFTVISQAQYLWDVMEQEIIIIHVQMKHLLCDAIMSLWTKSKERFQQFMPQRIDALLRAQGGQTWYYCKVAGECIWSGMSGAFFATLKSNLLKHLIKRK